MRPSPASGVRLHRDASVSDWLVEDYLETYIRWREESAAVRDAYAHLHTAARRDRTLAFAAFGAALDREETAARILAECADRVHGQLP